jgi:Fe-S oxidoreductase
LSDWLFLILLFFTTLTGILMHAVRLAGWPMGTYVIYVIHLAIAVPMLVIEVPFGKWSHLFYRPLAMFLSAVKEKASTPSLADHQLIAAEVGDTFNTCMQCGVCTSVCPLNWVSAFSPRHILRQLSLDMATEQAVDRATWNCLTCNSCGVECPRSIDLISVMKVVRGINVTNDKIPAPLESPLISLKQNGNPWGEDLQRRMEWAQGLNLPPFRSDQEYCLFTCCTTAYDPANLKPGRALIQLMDQAGVSVGSLGIEERCCGDQLDKLGVSYLFSEVSKHNKDLFRRSGARKILTTSPHCLNAFKTRYGDIMHEFQIEHYTELLDRLITEGVLSPVHEVSAIVTYHDPCYLGRHNGIYEAPRRILRSIPGIVPVEMPNNRAAALCCGSGSGNIWGNGIPNRRLGTMRIREALDTGASVIATACPYCIRMLNDAVKELDVGQQIAVRDPAELLLQSLPATAGTHAADHNGVEMDQEAYHV